MALNIGLDFGTHQTKICVENTDDPVNPIYRMFPFIDNHHKETFFLPSIIQVNQDETVSYGFVDKRKCFGVHQKASNNEIVLPQCPILTLPTKPTPPKKNKCITVDWKDALKNIKNNFNKHILSPEEQYENECKLWEEECRLIRDKYEQEYVNWEKLCEKLNSDFQEKEAEERANNLLYFRYFKQAYFTKSEWNKSIDSQTLCIWYLAYIIFLLQEEYGSNFSIQMGVPSSSKIHHVSKFKAQSILLNAYRLVETVFKGNFKSFLRISYKELLKITPHEGVKEGDAAEYSVLIFPEACVGLKPLVSQGKLPESKIQILVDIGGGTTDISLFTVVNGKLSVFYFTTIYKGLNFIREKCSDSYGDKIKNIIKSKMESDYYFTVKKEVSNLFSDLVNHFSKTGHDITRLKEALNKNMIIFSGGGSTYSELCLPVHPFNDVKKIDESILPIKRELKLDEKNKLHPLIIGAYGLAHSEISDDVVELKDLSELFNVQANNNEKRYKHTHGLLDD